MEQTLIYNNTTKPMSRCSYKPPHMGQNQEILVNESSIEHKVSSFSSETPNPSHDFNQKVLVPSSGFGNHEEDDVEDEESEFKMGRLIRQASLNSSHMSTPQQITKIMRGSTSLPRNLSEKSEASEEKNSNMRKYESMKERSTSRSKKSMKIGKNINGGAPTIPGRMIDKGLSEDMKAQIRFWARAVAFNVHQEC